MFESIRKVVVAFGCAVVILVAAPTGAMAQSSNIEGSVVGEDGQPLRGALIRIERTDIRGNYKVKTDKKGHYFHAGLPIGDYKVSCEVDGKVVDTVSGVHTTLGENREVDFDLAALKKKQAAMQAAAEAGQLTAEQTAGMSAEQKKALEEQIAKRQKALTKNKELNDAFNAAMAAKEAKDWDTAIQNFEKAGEVDPEQIVVWAQLAESYIEKAGTVTGAEKESALAKGVSTYEKAISLKPEDPAFHNNYALALARSGKLAEAEVELEKAAQLNPVNAGQYYFNLGALLLNTGNQEGAGSAFKKAIDLQPDYANAHFQYGMYLLSKAQVGDDGSIIPVEGTIEALQKYLELEPSGPLASSAQGALQSLQGTVETEYVNPDKKKTKK